MQNSSSLFANKIFRYFRVAAAVVSIGIVASCASRPQESEAIRTLLPMEAVEPEAYNVLPKNQADPDRVHSVLALSGGGANGAYGAGVLYGWGQSGNRPKFDVVTGVSTGALLSVFAFLGDDYDDEMKEAYTTVTERDIFIFRGIFGLFGTGLADNKPLKKQIEHYVTDETLARVAAEYDKGRRLYVATTNLDGGEAVIWDMGDIAKGGRTDKLLQFQKVLRASAAVPGVFDPVYIKPERGVQLRQAHVDGSVRTPFLLKDFMMQTSDKKRNVYVIINGVMQRREDTSAVKPNLLSISGKSIALLMEQLSEDVIFRGYELSRRTKSTFSMTGIPASYKQPTNPLQFDPKTMGPLFEEGRKAGLAGPGSWVHQPAGLGPLEKGEN